MNRLKYASLVLSCLICGSAFSVLGCGESSTALSPPTVLADNPVALNSRESATLRSLADPLGIAVGNVLSDSYGWPDPRIGEIAAEQFNFGFLEVYWFSVNPEPDVYTFAEQERLLGLAEAAQQKVFGHVIVWGNREVLPDWLSNGRWNRRQTLGLMQNHIQQVMTQFEGRINTWIVVNEAYSPGDFFREKVGFDYVDQAFAMARQQDPQAILLYNDFANETASGSNTRQTRQIVQRLRRKGLIDGVGLQMHLNGSEPPSQSDLVQTMRSYGIPVYITELDVDMRAVAGTQAERFEQQAQIYQTVLQAALEAGVDTLSVWGLADPYSWLETPPSENTSPLADPCFYDENLEPKPAHQQWIDGLAAQNQFLHP
ncbi:MAG: endo-1,4-beta-xylanase [Cyanobacteriota bacterium]|nr:endo-1,4-beta-xylanase [Cyanobacteriota bacterium]